MAALLRLGLCGQKKENESACQQDKGGMNKRKKGSIFSRNRKVHVRASVDTQRIALFPQAVYCDRGRWQHQKG